MQRLFLGERVLLPTIYTLIYLYVIFSLHHPIHEFRSVSIVSINYCPINEVILINITTFAINNILTIILNKPAMNEILIIQSKIYEIRGHKVMLDFDLAEMYGTETKYLKRSVKRNIERFEGDDFMFELTKDELSRCQICTLNNQRGHNFKYMPFVFTELGVAMLSSVLNSKMAIEVNRGIMRAFVAVRQLITIPSVDRIELLDNQMKELKEYIEEVFTDYNDINEDTRIQLDLINKTLAELQVQKKLSSKPRNPVGFVKPK